MDIEEKVDLLLSLHAATMSNTIVREALATLSPDEREALNKRLLVRLEEDLTRRVIDDGVRNGALATLTRFVTVDSAAWVEKEKDRLLEKVRTLYSAKIDAMLDDVVTRSVAAPLRDLVKTYLATLKLRG